MLLVRLGQKWVGHSPLIEEFRNYLQKCSEPFISTYSLLVITASVFYNLSNIPIRKFLKLVRSGA